VAQWVRNAAGSAGGGQWGCMTEHPLRPFMSAGIAMVALAFAALSPGAALTQAEAETEVIEILPAAPAAPSPVAEEPAEPTPPVAAPTTSPPSSAESVPAPLPGAPTPAPLASTAPPPERSSAARPQNCTGSWTSCSTRIGPALGPTTLPSIWRSCAGSP
jgi:hypothetical protein